MAQKVGLIRTSTYHTMRNVAFPYRITILQKSKEPDKLKCVKFRQWLLNFVHDHHSILNTCFFNDEAWFHLTNFINSHNYRMWSGENLHEYRESTLHSEKIGVWCGMSRKRIVGPIFSYRQLLGICTRILFNSLCPS